jgi:hypothetical protein
MKSIKIILALLVSIYTLSPVGKALAEAGPFSEIKSGYNLNRDSDTLDADDCGYSCGDSGIRVQVMRVPVMGEDFVKNLDAYAQFNPRMKVNNEAKIGLDLGVGVRYQF